MKRFFSYDPNDRIRFHNTAKEAKAEAEAALAAYRGDAADDGWDENVDEVMWGEVKGIATKSTTTAGEGETWNGEPVTEWVHFNLKKPQV